VSEVPDRPASSINVRQALAANVKRIRRLRELTGRQFITELEKRGVKLLPSGLTALEKGERRITVEELLAIAIVLNTNPVDLLMPADRERLEVADGLDPLNGYGLLYWLQGRRPWSQFVSMEDFVDAAREPHRAMLRAREIPVFKAMDALDSPLRLALTGPPVTEPLVPHLQHALDRLVKEVDNIIASIEVQEHRPDGW